MAAAKQHPVVASIDEVVINGDHAEANVTTFMAYAPQTRLPAQPVVTDRCSLCSSRDASMTRSVIDASAMLRRLSTFF